MRWNPRDKWVVSKDITHEPLIDDETFERAQATLQRRRRAACDRRMQGQYNHGDAYYRCRFPQEYALANQSPPPVTCTCGKTLSPTRSTPGWPPPSPHRIQQTITAMADAQPLDHPPATSRAAQTIITECDAKLERYRAALDAGADPAVVTGWIAQTQAERARAEADLHANADTTPRRMSRAEIAALVNALGDIAAVLRDADPADKAEVYRQPGLRLTHLPENANGARCSRSQHAPWSKYLVSEGDLNPHALYGH
ncbi:hypothetical protein [Micromonospora zamorensis]|uniref:hypothetical protein n=1 Tax=Micromonospora zamorensis TaxID=709883 RepID=UPI0039E18D65